MTGPAIFGLMIWVFYLRFTVPVLGDGELPFEGPRVFRIEGANLP